MDLSTTIIGLLLLALFILPVILISRAGKSKVKEFEKEFHRGVEKTIKQLLESNLQEWFFDCQEELTIEDYDEFSNYGDVNIKFNNEDLTLE